MYICIKWGLTRTTCLQSSSFTFCVHFSQICVSLVPIMAGVVIATVTEVQFDIIGMIAALTSTLFFALQNVYSKKVLIHIHTYVYVYMYNMCVSTYVCVYHMCIHIYVYTCNVHTYICSEDRPLTQLCSQRQMASTNFFPFYGLKTKFKICSSTFSVAIYALNFKQLLSLTFIFAYYHTYRYLS